MTSSLKVFLGVVLFNVVVFTVLGMVDFGAASQGSTDFNVDSGFNASNDISIETSFLENIQANISGLPAWLNSLLVIVNIAGVASIVWLVRGTA